MIIFVTLEFHFVQFFANFFATVYKTFFFNFSKFWDERCEDIKQNLHFIIIVFTNWKHDFATRICIYRVWIVIHVTDVIR